MSWQWCENKKLNVGKGVSLYVHVVHTSAIEYVSNGWVPNAHRTSSPSRGLPREDATPRAETRGSMFMMCTSREGTNLYLEMIGSGNGPSLVQNNDLLYIHYFIYSQPNTILHC